MFLENDSQQIRVLRVVRTLVPDSAVQNTDNAQFLQDVSPLLTTLFPRSAQGLMSAIWSMPPMTIAQSGLLQSDRNLARTLSILDLMLAWLRTAGDNCNIKQMREVVLAAILLDGGWLGWGYSPRLGILNACQFLMPRSGHGLVKCGDGQERVFTAPQFAIREGMSFAIDLMDDMRVYVKDGRPEPKYRNYNDFALRLTTILLAMNTPYEVPNLDVFGEVGWLRDFVRWGPILSDNWFTVAFEGRFVEYLKQFPDKTFDDFIGDLSLEYATVHPRFYNDDFEAWFMTTSGKHALAKERMQLVVKAMPNAFKLAGGGDGTP